MAVSEVLCETDTVHCRWCDNHFVVTTERSETLYDTEENVCVKRAFVGFVNDNDGALDEVFGNEAIHKENDVSHIFYDSFVSGDVFEKDGVQKEMTEIDIHLVRNTDGNGNFGNTTMIRKEDCVKFGTTVFVEEIWEMCGFFRRLFRKKSNKCCSRKQT